MRYRGQIYSVRGRIDPLETSNKPSNFESIARGIRDWRVFSATMIFYEANFFALLLAVGFLLHKQGKADETTQEGSDSTARNADNDTPRELPHLEDKKAISKFRWQFLIVYALVMGGDWLQGAHIYALYKDQYGFPEETVALFFTVGFLSGAVSAYFVGRLADKFGRRFMCCVFCWTYSLSCLSTLFNVKAIIFPGRMLGGISTSILYSAFEAWMVTEFHKRSLSKGGSLSHLFGTMTTVNSLVAITAGVISEALANYFGTRAAPFMGSILCFICAFLYMMTTWTENFGENQDSKKIASTQPSDENSPLIKRKPDAIKTIFTDKRIISLGFASCFFEGSMYLFVFFWAPSLKSTLPKTSLNVEVRSLPYGLIFANFMASMMLGSLVFNRIVSSWTMRHDKLIIVVLLASAATFLVDVFFSVEWIVFWGFCIFEVCVGMYYPTMGSLKGKYVDDTCRSAVYATLRIPLNVFVVCTLALTKEGDNYRNLVFMMCCGLLFVSAMIMQRFAGN